MADKSHGMVQEIRALRESEDFDLANYDTAQVVPHLRTPLSQRRDRCTTATRDGKPLTSICVILMSTWSKPRPMR